MLELMMCLMEAMALKKFWCQQQSTKKSVQKGKKFD